MAVPPTLTLVLVEDNRADVFLFEEALRRQGIAYRLAHFWNGAEALQHLRRAEPRPDLVVIDLHLPGMAGHEVLREIRAEPTLAGVPVAIISGAPPEQVAALDLQGADAILHKSVQVGGTLADIGSTVLRLCAGARLAPPSTAR